jgi:hypothetical protein
MMLPSITTDMIKERMIEVWLRADVAWQLRWGTEAVRFLAEYDYLSHWQTIDSVEKFSNA